MCSPGGPASIYVTHITLGTDGSHAHLCSLVFYMSIYFWGIQISHNTKTKITYNFRLLLRKHSVPAQVSQVSILLVFNQDKYNQGKLDIMFSNNI